MVNVNLSIKVMFYNFKILFQVGSYFKTSVTMSKVFSLYGVLKIAFNSTF